MNLAKSQIPASAGHGHSGLPASVSALQSLLQHSTAPLHIPAVANAGCHAIAAAEIVLLSVQSAACTRPCSTMLLSTSEPSHDGSSALWCTDPSDTMGRLAQKRCST